MISLSGLIEVVNIHSSGNTMIRAAAMATARAQPVPRMRRRRARGADGRAGGETPARATTEESVTDGTAVEVPHLEQAEEQDDQHQDVADGRGVAQLELLEALPVDEHDQGLGAERGTALGHHEDLVE